MNCSWFNRLWEINPNPTFLSNIAAFEAAIIAFLIPLSIEIISKISERYNSEVIIRSFENYWANKILPPFLLINIITTVVLRFCVRDDINCLAWRIIAWGILLCFIFIVASIGRVITRIKNYIVDTESVIDKLYEDIKKSIK